MPNHKKATVKHNGYTVEYWPVIDGFNATVIFGYCNQVYFSAETKDEIFTKADEIIRRRQISDYITDVSRNEDFPID
jgi:hypothetical protein